MNNYAPLGLISRRTCNFHDDSPRVKGKYNGHFLFRRYKYMIGDPFGVFGVRWD